MKRHIDKRKQYILIGGLALLGFALAYRSLLFLEGFQSQKTEIVAKQKHLAKYQVAVAQRDELKADLDYLERSLQKMESGLFAQKAPALVAVDIQNLLNKIVETCGAEITMVKILKPNRLDQEAYLSIPVQFTLMSNITQLKEVLFSIERSVKYLTIGEARITATSTVKPGILKSTLTVAGFMKSGPN